MSTDADVIRRSRDHPPAFAELYDRHAPTIGAFAARRLGAGAVEDLVAETFLVAFRKRASYDDGYASALPWLFGIATRLVRRHRRIEAEQWRAFSAASGAFEGHAEPASAAVDQQVDAELRLRALAPAIARLAQRDRDALLLYAWGSMSYEDVARALDVPVGTVRSRLNRVRRQLAAALPPQRAVLVGERDGGL